MPTINSREIEVFKPYDSEYPEALLFAQGCDEATVDAFRDEEIVRVAKRGEEVLGLYVMRSKDNQGQRPEIYELLCVIVEPAVRKQGLGRCSIRMCRPPLLSATPMACPINQRPKPCLRTVGSTITHSST